MFNRIFAYLFIGIITIILFSAMFHKNDSIVEGLDNKKKFKSYKKDPIQLATKNEENIKVLRAEVDDMKKIANKAAELKKAVDDNSKSLDGLIKQQQSQTSSLLK
tara:strand:- start:3328 stop:3642 length:315 start_codon:yes stop_codon:yes gene_type:complete